MRKKLIVLYSKSKKWISKNKKGFFSGLGTALIILLLTNFSEKPFVNNLKIKEKIYKELDSRDIQVQYKLKRESDSLDKNYQMIESSRLKSILFNYKNAPSYENEDHIKFFSNYQEFEDRDYLSLLTQLEEIETDPVQKMRIIKVKDIILSDRYIPLNNELNKKDIFKIRMFISDSIRLTEDKSVHIYN